MALCGRCALIWRCLSGWLRFGGKLWLTSGVVVGGWFGLFPGVALS